MAVGKGSMDRAAKTTAAQKETQIKEAVKTEAVAKAPAKAPAKKPAAKKPVAKKAPVKKAAAKKAPAKKTVAAPGKAVIAATHPQVLGMIEYEKVSQMIDQNAEVRPDLRVEVGDPMPVYYF